MADEPAADEKAARLALLNQAFADGIPHNHALGLRIVDFAEGSMTMLLPYAAHLVGNPETGVMHGGAVTATLDACSGGAVYMRLGDPTGIATLDLRIDYLRPATPGRDVVCRAECYRTTKNVGFVRALAYHERPDDPIAAAAGAFMIFPKSRRSLREGEAAP